MCECDEVMKSHANLWVHTPPNAHEGNVKGWHLGGYPLSSHEKRCLVHSYLIAGPYGLWRLGRPKRPGFWSKNIILSEILVGIPYKTWPQRHEIQSNHTNLCIVCLRAFGSWCANGLISFFLHNRFFSQNNSAARCRFHVQSVYVKIYIYLMFSFYP